MQDDTGDDDPDEEQEHGEGNRTDQRFLAQRGEPLGESTQRTVLDQDERCPTDADQAGDGHRQRGESEVGDEPPLHEPKGSAGKQRNSDGADQRHARLVEDGDEHSGEAHHRCHGEIDLGVDDHERHDHDDDDLLDRQLEEIHEVVDAEIEGREDQVGDDDRDEDGAEQQLPATRRVRRSYA